MDITPLIMSDQMVVQAYRDGVFKISGQSYAQAVIVFPDRVVPWDGKLASLLAYKDALDVVLHGTGAKLTLPDAQMRLDMKAQGLRVEYMDTGAACRTYNVLLAEGRRVAAALLPV